MVRQAFSISNTDTINVIHVHWYITLRVCINFIRMHGHKFWNHVFLQKYFHNQCQSLCLEIVPGGGRGEYKMMRGVWTFSVWKWLGCWGVRAFFFASCLLANDPWGVWVLPQENFHLTYLHHGTTCIHVCEIIMIQSVCLDSKGGWESL